MARFALGVDDRLGVAVIREAAACFRLRIERRGVLGDGAVTGVHAWTAVERLRAAVELARIGRALRGIARGSGKPDHAP